MAARAATRTALLGLALLALQHSPAGAYGDDSPEQGSRGPQTSTSRTPTALLKAHRNHHPHEFGGGHRSYHSAASPESFSVKNLPPADSLSSEMKHRSKDEDLKKYYKDKDDASSQPEMEDNGERVSSDIMNEPPKPGTYIPSNCTNCLIREELRNLTLQAIKEQILNKLGMKNAPNITGREMPILPKHLNNIIDMYDMQSDQPDRLFQPGAMIHDEEDDFHAKTSMVIVVAQTTKLRHGGGIGTDMDIQHFRFSEHAIRNKVTDASMHIYLPVMPRPIRIHVYRVMGNATEHQSMLILQVASTKFSEQRKPGWVQLDTTKLITDWFKSPRDNLGVVVKLEDDTGKYIPYSVESQHDHKKDPKQPFVQVQTTDGRKHRNKRTIGLDCHEKSQETRCCRYPLTVDFEKFGWDWIIAPKTYDANYCSGECPYVFQQKYPHTHIVQQANLVGIAGPCCASRKLSGISMLYFDNDFNIVYGILPGMIVDRCGCQ